MRVRAARRAAALLAATLLGLGPAPVGPASAGSAAPATDDRGAALAQAAQLARSLPHGGKAADQVLRYDDVVTDPRGDVHHPLGAARGTVRRPHADILRASYRTPWRAGRDITVAVTWAELRDGRSPGVRAQQQLTMMQHPGSGRTWFFWLGNTGGRAKLFDVSGESGETTRILPRRLDVERVPGVGGRTIVRLSTEWLPVGRVRFFTFSQSRDAVDDVDPSVLLDVARR